ncbi:MAG: hypothetical protein QOJ40_1759 [Verrucomicrobiota bacterium]
MFDTIHFFCPRRLPHQPLPPGWSLKAFADTAWGASQAETRHTHRYLHVGTGLTAAGAGEEIKHVKCSLPHVLFGTNGKLIKNAAELHEAERRVDDILDEISVLQTGSHYYTRVDLVWQFLGDAELFKIAHRQARHTRIRKDAGQYDGESMYWRGSNLKIRIYDKGKELKLKRRDAVRVEVELHGRLLKELLGDGSHLRTLDFDRAYQAYREIMLGFCPADVPRVSDLVELLATGEAFDWSANGVSVFELWKHGKNPEHIHRVQKHIAALRPRFFNLDWAKLLPADGPPEPVEIASTNL